MARFHRRADSERRGPCEAPLVMPRHVIRAEPGPRLRPWSTSPDVWRADAPVLLIIDEFGKNLEAISERRDADPYLLQQLAEAGQGSGLPIFMLTLQHLSLEDHLAAADGPRRREWIKVSGRFEDIAYVESAAATRTLIGKTFRVGDHTLQSRIAQWAQPHAEAMRSLGVSDLADPDAVASCYPLHPLVAAVLPELCSRYGQHERTLFSFLTGADRASAASFLANTESPTRGSLPCLGLDAVYDYFVGSDGFATLSSGRSSRWIEVAGAAPGRSRSLNETIPVGQDHRVAESGADDGNDPGVVAGARPGRDRRERADRPGESWNRHLPRLCRRVSELAGHGRRHPSSARRRAPASATAITRRDPVGRT